MTPIPNDWPVRPIREGTKAWIAAKDRATCGACGRSWDDGKITSMTPAPGARCPFEAFHDEPPQEAERPESDFESTVDSIYECAVSWLQSDNDVGESDPPDDWPPAFVKMRAADDLLAALKPLVAAYHARIMGGNVLLQAIKDAESAIARAEGRIS